MLFMQL